MLTYAESGVFVVSLLCRLVKWRHTRWSTGKETAGSLIISFPKLSTIPLDILQGHLIFLTDAAKTRTPGQIQWRWYQIHSTWSSSTVQIRLGRDLAIWILAAAPPSQGPRWGLQSFHSPRRVIKYQRWPALNMLENSARCLEEDLLGLETSTGLGWEIRCCREQSWQRKHAIDASTLELCIHGQHLVAAPAGVDAEPWLT
jgi:hypothetical protein